MFGLGWSEMVLIGIVALIVIGPKDLPGMFKTMGEFTGKARGMAREFSRAMEDAAKDSGVNEISSTLRTAANPQKFGVDKIREATGIGPETAKLSAERQASKEKMDAAMAKAATDRQAKAAAEAETSKAATAPKPKAAKPKTAAKPKPKPKAKPKSKPKGDA